MSLKDTKAKIKAVRKTGQVAKAMEAVSAAKMRKTQENAISARPNAYLGLSILKRLTEERETIKHPLMTQRENGPVLVVLIMSDRGLAGSLNSGLTRLVDREILRNPNQTFTFITCGRKAEEYARKRNLTISKVFPSFLDKVEMTDITSLSQKILENYNEGGYSKVWLAYTNFISTFLQEPLLRQVLPIKTENVEAVLSGIRPAKGKFASLFEKEEIIKSESVAIFEPSSTEVLDSLIPFLIETLIFHAILENKASEHSARMIAMKSAKDKVIEVNKELNREYNKERQSMITREMSEIVSGIEALK